MKKIILTLVFVTTLLLVSSNSASATLPCSAPLPAYINDLSKHFESIKVSQDACYPSYSFETPSSYSSYGIRYVVNNGYINTPPTFDEFDKKIKEIITKSEKCPSSKEYIEISGFISMPLNYFLEYPGFNSCTNIDGILETLRNQKIVHDFLSQQEKFGDYSVCTWPQDGEGMLLSYSGGIKYGYLSFYILCDGVKESLRLVTENNKVKEAFFQNSESEIYRKIYPEDLIIRERIPAWEKDKKQVVVVIFALIVILAVAATLIIRITRRNRRNR